MRRGQRRSLKSIPRHATTQSWFPVLPLVYGCDPAPVKTLAHKYVKVLKRLAKGGVMLIRMNGKWYWSKGQRLLGTVKNAIVEALKDANLLHGIGGRWMLTPVGHDVAALVPDRRAA